MSEEERVSSPEAVVQQPDWWHRDHPVFTPLAGFFTGLAVVVVVPSISAAVLSALLGTDDATRLIPFVAVLLALPLALMVVPRSRRFGLYMLLGMVLTAVVAVGVAAATLWILVRLEG
ncbi:hypothetical protein [Nocardioides insulae]|uniref:hypothetical protein n=1 Tax=Nocardioides insulae TaxID=394734 RepID=UPI00048EA704|nr:hypothetical protein [Nocardioides insulae]